MAGDWIKLEVVTPDKPEVHGIAERLKISAEQVLGGMCRVWIWADQQSVNGNALSVTENAIDRISRVPGLARAMREEGWMLGSGGKVSLPNFDRHNGKTAKQRALTNKRVDTHRKRSGNGYGVTSALPEKRREEITPLPPSGAFVRFWAAWPSGPRKHAKGKCWEAWRKGGFDGQIETVVSHVEAMKATSEWQREKGRFVVAPLVYINQRRWEGAEVGDDAERAVAL